MSPRENRLAEETSPYLLQHADNPVDWYPWGEEALERAEKENKPILLSIGYAACHWCHVMERECFEDEDIAALMNEHFVCIKVDREERPDLDDIYMQATVAMSGAGGWPMTVFLTPGDRKPFFAGTYFPPEDKYGRPGFPTLLRRIAELWNEQRESLELQAKELTEHLEKQARTTLPGAVSESSIERAAAQLAESYDEDHGGFGSAPKFPPAQSLELLLRHHRRTGDEQALQMVRGTLEGMARGGLYDHLGGGFARYSTDDRWLVPHFEKMLYDNALLLRVYAHAHQVSGSDEDARVVRETCDFVLRAMTSEDGAFFSAIDADSEGVEGKYYVWTPEEVRAVLPPEQARAFCAHYDVTAEGNWEGKSILHTPRSKEEVAGELGTDVAGLEALLEPAREKMLAARYERVPPLTDDKILTAWSALMLGALAECGRVFDEPRWRDAAARAADFLLETMKRPDGGLYRTTRAGKTHLEAYLEDYAFFADALVDLYEAGMGAHYLDAAREMADRIVADFAADDGGFYATARGHEKLIVRMRESQDGAIPSAGAVAARVLTRLAWHLGEEGFRRRAADAVQAQGKLVEQAPRAFATTLTVADMLLEGPVEVVLAGEDHGPLAAEVGRHYLPNRVIVRTPGARAPEALVAGKEPLEGKPTLYVCRDFACKRPTTDPDEVASVLGAEQEAAIGGRAGRVGAILAGRATPEGTARLRDRHSELGEQAHAQLADTGLWAGRIGFGGYRVDDRTPTFAEALEKALRGGCNLIDTSTNYADGGSEKLVGSVLAKLVGDGTIAREECVVVSKIGYVQGDDLAIAKRRQQAGRPFPEMVELSESSWHCIHPDFIAEQLDRSLDRLGLETLDLCLLHNPEYFLSDAQARGGVDDDVVDRFYDRIERAFAHLEEQVAAGRIGAYGVSSNTLAADRSEPDATEVSRLREAAERAAGQGHGFRAVQLPLNLLESRAARDGTLEAARDAGLAVLVNRPLNAITDEGLLRLASPAEVEAPEGSFADQLAVLRRAEDALDERMGSLVRLPGDHALSDVFAYGRQLAQLDGELSSPEQVDQLAQGQILPRLGQAFSAVEGALPASARGAWRTWREEYLAALEQALLALRAQAAERAEKALERVERPLEAVLPLVRQSEGLARKALWTLTSTPGVDVVLLGMRRPAYVDDALAVLSWPPLREPQRAYEAVSV